MATPRRKILSPVFEPTIPLEKIREAVRVVAAETRKKADIEVKEGKASTAGQKNAVRKCG